MISCEILQDGKIKERVEESTGMVFADNNGIECVNAVCTPLIEASLKEYHYDKFGIMRQHYLGHENASGFRVRHEVRPAMMFSVAMSGHDVACAYGNSEVEKAINWNKGEANLSFLGGEGIFSLNVNEGSSLDLLNIVIPHQFIIDLINRSPEAFDFLAPYAKAIETSQMLYKTNRKADRTVLRAAKDIERCRLMGNMAHAYLETKIIECLAGFVTQSETADGRKPLNIIIRDKIHDARDIVVANYRDMPSLGALAKMVGTNECTLKSAFKQEFGTTVFQYLFDLRMEMAKQYLLDTDMPIAEIGYQLGYDYQSHFSTAFRRKYGVSPVEFRACRGAVS